MQDVFLASEGDKAHAVFVHREVLVMEEEAAVLGEFYLVGAAQHELLAAADVLHEFGDAVDINRLWLFTSEAEKDGLVGGVADSREGEGAVDICLNSSDLVKEVLFLELVHESFAGFHWPKSV